AENELHILFDVFLRKGAKSEIHEVRRLNPSIEQFFPKHYPRSTASERILELRQMFQEKTSALLVQRKVSIGHSTARGQDKLRRRIRIDFGFFFLELDWNGFQTLV